MAPRVAPRVRSDFPSSWRLAAKASLSMDGRSSVPEMGRRTLVPGDDVGQERVIAEHRRGDGQGGVERDLAIEVDPAVQFDPGQLADGDAHASLVDPAVGDGQGHGLVELQAEVAPADDAEDLAGQRAWGELDVLEDDGPFHLRLAPSARSDRELGVVEVDAHQAAGAGRLVEDRGDVGEDPLRDLVVDPGLADARVLGQAEDRTAGRVEVDLRLEPDVPLVERRADRVEEEPALGWPGGRPGSGRTSSRRCRPRPGRIRPRRRAPSSPSTRHRQSGRWRGRPAACLRDAAPGSTRETSKALIASKSGETTPLRSTIASPVASSSFPEASSVPYAGRDGELGEVEPVALGRVMSPQGEPGRATSACWRNRGLDQAELAGQGHAVGVPSGVRRRRPSAGEPQRFPA